MKTRAAVLEQSPAQRPYAESRPLKIMELDLAPPGPDEVMVRIKAAGLCHSDLSVVNGDRPRPVPMALGHEASGIVEALGPGVSDLAVGDRVVMVFMPSCGHCAPCAEGRPALCEPGAEANGAGMLLRGTRRLSRHGRAVHHHVGVSAFADRAVVSRRSLVKVDPDLPFEHAALFGCAVLTGVGAVVNTAGVQAGQSVAVIGLGGVGLNAVLGAVAAGASEIIAVDPVAAKRELAERLGASASFNPGDESAAARIRELTQGGVDAAVEMAGSVRALEFAYRITRRGGVTVTGGLANPAHLIGIQQVSLVGEERTLKGSYMGSSIPSRDIPRYVALHRAGRLPIEKLLTSRGPLEEINEALDALADGSAIRHIIDL